MLPSSTNFSEDEPAHRLNDPPAAVLAPAPRRSTSVWQRLVALRKEIVLATIVTVVSTVVVGELGVRLMSETDLDGNWRFLGQRVPPLQLPVAGINAAVQKFQASTEAVIIEDPDLGWVTRPNSHNDLFTFNNIGVRVTSADRVYGLVAPAGVVRIQVFGDSFALGDEVSNAESWARRFEQRLNDTAVPTEVMNFGVNGYGIDQAFLRWRKSGHAFAPDVVVFALQTENVRRTVNMIRPLYVPVIDLPFSKPRFMRSDGKLTLINTPTIPAAQLAGRVERLAEWPLLPFEAYFDAADFNDHFWQRSKLVAVAAHVLSSKPENREAEEQFALSLEIIAAFEESVRAAGGRFVILLTPRLSDLRALRDQHSTPDTRFVEAVSRRFQVVNPVADLARLAPESDIRNLFRPGGHYSKEGSDLLAAAVARELTSAKAPAGSRH